MPEKKVRLVRGSSLSLTSKVRNKDFSVLTSETSSRQYFNHRIEVRTPLRIRPYPMGRLLGMAMFQALRARLRSRCPSRTKAIRPWGSSHQVSAYGVSTPGRPLVFCPEGAWEIEPVDLRFY